MVQTRRQSARLRKLPPRDTSASLPPEPIEEEPASEETPAPVQTPKPRRKSTRSKSQPKDDIETRWSEMNAKTVAPISEMETKDNGPSALGTDSPSKSTPKALQQTPQKRIGLTPSGEEMHPAHHHQSTVKNPDHGLALGFYEMNQASNGPPPSNFAGALAAAQKTPTRTAVSDESNTYPFTFGGNLSLALDPEKLRLLSEIRKNSDLHQGAGEGPNEVLMADPDVQRDRVIARPKTKNGRYSAAHHAQFNKMDSIADHPSLRRREPIKTNGTSSPSKPAAEPMAAKKSLKRTQSKAELHNGESHSRPTSSPSKVPRPEPSTVNKRFKAEAGPASNIPVFAVRASQPHAKSTISSLSRSPSKSSIPRPPSQQPSTPTRGVVAPVTPNTAQPSRSGILTPAIRAVQSVRAATKTTFATFGLRKFPAGATPRPAEKSIIIDIKAPSPTPQTPPASRKVTEASLSPVPSPSPLKTSSDGVTSATLQPPSRLRPPREPALKSILRSPSRLYSDDPSKLAAGTHLVGKQRAVSGSPTRSGPTLGLPRPKRVDFSASVITKADLQEKRSASAEPPVLPKTNGTPCPKRSEVPSFDEPADAMADVSPTPRQLSTFTPSNKDFTFKFGERRLTFAPVTTNTATDKSKTGSVPLVRASDVSPSRHSVAGGDVFYPSLEPLLRGSKRKHDSVEETDSILKSDKENSAPLVTPSFQLDGPESTAPADAALSRPAKRVRTGTGPTATGMEPKTPESQVRTMKPIGISRTAPVNKSKFARRETIGHLGTASASKPAFRSGGLTRERLNLLATPKRHV